MPQDREPALREICAQRPRLLRVERVPSRAARAAQRSRVLLLSFDRLQLSLCPDDEDEAVAIAVHTAAAPLLEDTLRADEEEPWWMLLGAPLVAAWKTSAALELQFRDDGSNPKIVSVELADGQLRARAQPKSAWTPPSA